MWENLKPVVLVVLRASSVTAGTTMGQKCGSTRCIDFASSQTSDFMDQMSDFTMGTSAGGPPPSNTAMNSWQLDVED